MKIETTAGALKDALSGLGAVRAGRRQIPVLRTVLIQAAGGRASILASDLDVWRERAIDGAEAPASGKIAVDAGALARFAGVVPAAAPVAIEAVAGCATMTAEPDGGSALRWTDIEQPTADFPSEPPTGWKMLLARGRVDAGVLRAAIERPRFATSTEETRYYLGGIFLHREGDALRAVATDGHRLAVIEQPVDGMRAVLADGHGAGILVPNKALPHLLRALPHSDAGAADAVTVSLFGAGGNARPEFLAVAPADGAAEVRTRLIDGTFPDVSRVIPKAAAGETATIARFDRARLLAGIRTLVRLCGRGRGFEHGSFACAFDADGVGLTLRNPIRLGRAETRVPGAVAGPPLRIGFHPRYVADALAAARGDEVEIRMPDAATPATFHGDDDRAFFSLIMPRRI